MEPKIQIHVLPGGTMPKRQTEGAIGYDAHLRAIVSAKEKDPANPILRRTLFDFENYPEDPEMAKCVMKVGDELIYRLEPRKRVLVGIGFVTAMPFPMFYWVAPRSGLASMYGVTVANAPGTIDPDYRGEAGVVVFNQGEELFDLKRGMRIAQIIFMKADIPEVTEVRDYADLTSTNRGTGGFGSTGL